MRIRYFGICWGLVLVALVVTVIAYPYLPARVPTHWNAQNQVNGYSPRWALFLWGPVFMAGITGLFGALPWLSPKHFAVETFRGTCLYIMLLVVGLFAYTQALILWSALAGPINIAGASLGAVSIFLALLGNVMGKVRRNFWIGIRTPWTLANERVWNSTHRFAAKAMVLTGIAGLIVALAGAVFWLWISVILLGVLSSAVYSLIYYKRLERKGLLGV